jgi:hypothetical protein
MRPKLIKHGAVIDDTWQVLREIPEGNLPDGKINAVTSAYGSVAINHPLRLPMIYRHSKSLRSIFRYSPTVEAFRMDALCASISTTKAKCARSDNSFAISCIT